MRKIFTLIAMAAFAATVSAQKIEFTQKYDKLNVPGTFEKDGFVLTVTDTDDSGKISVDGNTAYFGTADNYVSFGFRLKTGGKSSSKNGLSLTLPQDGTIKIYARTGSNSATDRNVILTQKDTSVELLNKVLLESEAVETVIDGDVKKVYPVLSASAKAGSPSPHPGHGRSSEYPDSARQRFRCCPLRTSPVPGAERYMRLYSFQSCPCPDG